MHCIFFIVLVFFVYGVTVNVVYAALLSCRSCYPYWIDWSQLAGKL